jgi:hypothetical protein
VIRLCLASSKDVRVETTMMKTPHWIEIKPRKSLILFLPLHYLREKKLSGKAS